MFNELYDIFDAAINTIVEKYGGASWTEIFNDERMIEVEKIIMETGIHTSLLPSMIQEKLEEGIFFESIEKLYDFLENYSSWFYWMFDMLMIK